MLTRGSCAKMIEFSPDLQSAKLAFGCQAAFGSRTEMLKILETHITIYHVAMLALHKSCAWYIVFKHANTCASMDSLVKIHNNLVFRSFLNNGQYVWYLDRDLETGYCIPSTRNPLLGRIYYSEFWVEIHPHKNLLFSSSIGNCYLIKNSAKR